MVNQKASIFDLGESKRPNTYRVYDSKQMVVPKYIVKPDPWGKGYRVYEAGKPVLPVYRIEQKDQWR